MNYLSVCSGIEAASVAWHPLGWNPIAFSEIEKFPSAVLAHHYPNVPNLGDMTKHKEWSFNEPINLLVGGTPCQSFSVAGLRKGMDDPRGNLALTYLAIADQFRPEWLLWENVPGVLTSSGGKDFGSLLGALAELGYGFAYRVLDAQFFGVPQRRRRVFLVASARGWQYSAAVLFERESLQRNTKPSRKKGEITPTLSASGTGVSRVGFNCEDEWFIPQVAGTLDTECGGGRMNHQTACSGHILPVKSFYESSLAQYKEAEVAGTLKASGGVLAGGSETFLAIQDVSGRDKRQNGKGWSEEQISYTLDATGLQGISTPNAVRRLTPTECERLQGFPDGYTNVPWRGKDESPDGPRYKALGNSMAVPVMRWIGERIKKVVAL